MLGRDTLRAIVAHLIQSRPGRSTDPGRMFRSIPDMSWVPEWPDSQAASKAAAHLAAMFRLPEDTSERLSPEAPLGRWVDVLDQDWDRKAVTFSTSGSQGEPVSVTHGMDLMLQEAGFLARLFAPADRLHLVVPLHHIYGFLFGGLLPGELGAQRVSRAPWPSPEWAEDLGGKDLVIGFPLFWKAVARTNIRFGPGVRGVTSTGPCPADAVRAALGKGLACMTEIYGSSETGGMAHRQDASGPYRLFPYWSRKPGGDGMALSRELPGGGGADYRLPDDVQWLGERELLPAGRKDKAVQVGGVNVSPLAVRRILLGHPEIADCAVRLDTATGRLKAFVVPATAAPDADLRRAVEAWMRGRLTPPETPRSLTFGPSLPANAMGKDADWDVASE